MRSSAANTPRTRDDVNLAGIGRYGLVDFSRLGTLRISVQAGFDVTACFVRAGALTCTKEADPVKSAQGTTYWASYDRP
jgi:hypothetical protein